MPQPPTISQIRVRSTADALVIFHAVSLGILPIISRRLDNEERRAISSGCVYVWEERGAQSEATGLGIERWTDGIRWGPSRVRDEFLFYHEKGTTGSVDPGYSSESDMSPTTETGPRPSQRRDTLIKQTYSVFLQSKPGKRKWHMIAYFTQDTVDYLHTVDDLPQLASISVPLGAYVPARCSKGRLRSAARKLSISSPSVPASSYTLQPPHREKRQRRDVEFTRPPPSPYRYSPTSYFLSPSPPSGPPPSQNSWYIESKSGFHSTTASSKTPSPYFRGGDLGNRERLAPLEYLQNLTPPRRLPFDERALSALCASS